MLDRKLYGMAKTSLVFFLVGISIFLDPKTSQSAAFVDEKYQFSIFTDERGKIEARRHQALSLFVSMPGEIDVDVRVHNKAFRDISVWVCDENSYRKFVDRRSNGCRGIKKGKGVIQLSHSASYPGEYYVVLDNSYSRLMTKKVSVDVSLRGTLSEEKQRGLERSFGDFTKLFSQMFSLREFDMYIMPCGEMNAWSNSNTGDIRFCSELFYNLIYRKLGGAVEGIMYHEFAHTLLNLKGLPNYDNEETVDELSLVLLLWSGRQERAIDLIKYLKDQDPRRQAEAIIKYGDRHPVSVQRIRNIERILENPNPVVRRWNQLLYPYLSDGALRSFIDNPGRFHDRELLREYLN